MYARYGHDEITKCKQKKTRSHIPPAFDEEEEEEKAIIIISIGWLMQEDAPGSAIILNTHRLLAPLFLSLGQILTRSTLPCLIF